MQDNVDLIAQIITIVLGIAAFYSVVTKPIKDSVGNLAEKIEKMNEDSISMRITLAKVYESVKSAHKRIDDLEER